jgi:hypothetical protein
VKLERISPGQVRMTLHVYELASLTAAARWALEGGHGELAVEARDQLAAVLTSYERAVGELDGGRALDPL